jgi:uncharacterized protein YrrD
MFLGKDIIGNPVITVSGGRSIGRVQDVYLTVNLQSVAALYLGSKGLFSRSAFLVKSEDVVTMDEDAVIVKHDDVIQEEKDIPYLEEAWL